MDRSTCFPLTRFGRRTPVVERPRDVDDVQYDALGTERTVALFAPFVVNVTGWPDRQGLCKFALRQLA